MDADEEHEENEEFDEEFGERSTELAATSIEVTGLSLYTHHGVSDAEQEIGQRLVFDLRFDSLVMQQSHDILRREIPDRMPQELALRMIRVQNSLSIGGVRDVAASPPGHEDLDAGSRVLLEQYGFEASFGGTDGSKYSGGAGANDHHV